MPPRAPCRPRAGVRCHLIRVSRPPSPRLAPNQSHLEVLQLRGVGRPGRQPKHPAPRHRAAEQLPPQAEGLLQALRARHRQPAGLRAGPSEGVRLSKPVERDLPRDRHPPNPHLRGGRPRAASQEALDLRRPLKLLRCGGPHARHSRLNPQRVRRPPSRRYLQSHHDHRSVGHRHHPLLRPLRHLRLVSPTNHRDHRDLGRLASQLLSRGSLHARRLHTSGVHDRLHPVVSLCGRPSGASRCAPSRSPRATRPRDAVRLLLGASRCEVVPPLAANPGPSRLPKDGGRRYHHPQVLLSHPVRRSRELASRFRHHPAPAECARHLGPMVVVEGRHPVDHSHQVARAAGPASGLDAGHPEAPARVLPAVVHDLVSKDRLAGPSVGRAAVPGAAAIATNSGPLTSRATRQQAPRCPTRWSSLSVPPLRRTSVRN